jgi:fructokinase
VAAGRLGAPVRLLARLGTGPLAANLRRHAELAGVLPDAAAILHVGSISSWTAPGCDAIARLVQRLHSEGGALISVDPNLRPMLADGPVGATLGNSADVVRARLDRLVAQADVVKVSAEDLTWLEGPRDLDEAALDWAARGPALVLLTDGGAPLRIARPGGPVLHRETPRVPVADTVGAGDSLAAGLLSGLLEAGVSDRAALAALPEEELLRVVDDAALVAALNCTRVGADPPTRAELAAAREGSGRGQ